MGCVQKKKEIKVSINKEQKKNHFLRNSLSLGDKFSTINQNEDSKTLIKNKCQRITTRIWIKILNYLNYNELKETGKVNRFFNNTVKQKEILVKFFKKKDTEVNIFPLNNKIFEKKTSSFIFINSMMSFSVLQNNNCSSDDELSTNDMKN
jgi:hypothetical protein